MSVIKRKNIPFVLMSLLSMGCLKAENAADPLESMNRKTFAFNSAFEATAVQPIARTYNKIAPAPAKKGIRNFFQNLQMLPTFSNDMLQGNFLDAYKTSWRFVINSTLGIGGFIDIAKHMGLPAHYNDLGITLAKWGDKKSPYLVLPFFGPSTIRDAWGWTFDSSLVTAYAYITPRSTSYALYTGRYIQLYADFLEAKPMIDESFDKYAFVRDAFLQNRQYQIEGKKASTHDEHSSTDDSSDLYVDEFASLGHPASKSKVRLT